MKLEDKIEAIISQIDAAHDCEDHDLADRLEGEYRELARHLPKGTHDPATVPDPLANTSSILQVVRSANLINADLRGADLSDANLSGANLSGAKQRVFRIDGSRHQITAIDDDVCIGCICMSLADWLEQFETVGSREGYSPVEIAGI